MRSSAVLFLGARAGLADGRWSRERCSGVAARYTASGDGSAASTRAARSACSDVPLLVARDERQRSVKVDTVTRALNGDRSVTRSIGSHGPPPDARDDLRLEPREVVHDSLGRFANRRHPRLASSAYGAHSREQSASR